MPHSEASDVGLLLFLKVPSALHALECASALHAEGCGLDPRVRQHSFIEIGHEIIYSAIISLPLIQVGLAKGCALAQEQCPSRHNQRY